jgi:hypothetical protein
MSSSAAASPAWPRPRPSAPLIARARENAVLNGLAERIEYHVANLMLDRPENLDSWGRIQKQKINPTRRAGAGTDDGTRGGGFQSSNWSIRTVP